MVEEENNDNSDDDDESRNGTDFDESVEDEVGMRREYLDDDNSFGIGAQLLMGVDDPQKINGPKVNNAQFHAARF